MREEIPAAKLHDDGVSCRCPYCGKHNTDLDVAGNPVGEEFNCLRCGGEFRIADAPLAAEPSAQGVLTDEKIAEIYTHTFESQPGCARSAPRCPPLVILFARAIAAHVKGETP